MILSRIFLDCKYFIKTRILVVLKLGYFSEYEFIVTGNDNFGWKVNTIKNGGIQMVKDSHAPKKKSNKAKLPNEQRRAKGSSDTRGGNR